MIDWDSIRAQFPGLQNYTYLDSAAGGITPVSVADAGKRFYDESIEGGDIYWDTWRSRVSDVRSKVAAFLGATPEEIAFLTSTSQAISYLALMLKGKGEVLTMEDEYQATTIPWSHAGYKVTFVKPEADNSYTLDTIKKYIAPETRIFAMSHVQSPTGARLDIEAVAEFCRANNYIFVINATQSACVVPIDLSKVQPDFLVFQANKWGLAGYGNTVLYINKKYFGSLSYPICGTRAVEDEGQDNKSTRYKKHAAALEVGAVQFPNIFALGAAIDLIASIGIENVWSRVSELNNLIERGLDDSGFTILSPRKPEFRSGITAIQIADPGTIVKALKEQKVIVSEKKYGIRISTHFFNNEADVQRVLTSLREYK